jgi:hypothetical protein
MLIGHACGNHTYVVTAVTSVKDIRHWDHGHIICSLFFLLIVFDSGFLTRFFKVGLNVVIWFF